MPIDATRAPAFDTAIEQSVARDFDGCLDAAKGAVSDNTERARRADLGLFAAWCRARGLAARPASPDTSRRTSTRWPPSARPPRCGAM